MKKTAILLYILLFQISPYLMGQEFLSINGKAIENESGGTLEDAG